MAKVAEGIARVASEIATSRRQRGELAAEIKVTTRRRHGDVQSFLEVFRTSRGKATHERAAAGRKMVKARHTEVFSLLRDLKSSRGKRAASSRRKPGKRCDPAKPKCLRCCGI